MVDEREVEAFWAAHPCGEQLVSGAAADSYERFFSRYDELRYRLESHIPACLDAVGFGGKQVLEIGLGQGADSEQIIRRGGRWTGVDLTLESVERVRTRLTLRRLPFEALVAGSALNLPFAESSFDLIYSHGVLHHIPEVQRAQAEMARVLRPGGRAVIMVYAKHSLNYLLSILVLLRLGLIALYGAAKLGVGAEGVYAAHLESARRIGLRRYLRLGNFLSRSTDGPLNPYTKVYDRAKLQRGVPDFEIERLHKEFMHAPPLPVHRLPGAHVCGWHLWAHLLAS